MHEGTEAAVGYVFADAGWQRRQELRRRWLEASAWLGEALRPPIDGPLAQRRITDVARSISGAAATAFVQWPAGRDPVISMTEGTDRGVVTSLVEELTSSPDLSMPPRDVLRPLVGGRPAIVVPMRSQIADPAALVAFFGERGDLSAAAEDSELLESLADHASLALDRVEAAADRAELEDASLHGRASRELHDVVIQRLFATGLQLEGMRLGLSDPAARERLDRAIEDIDLTIRHIREAVFAAGRARTDRS